MRVCFCVVAIASLLTATFTPANTIVLTTSGVAVTENFNTLSMSSSSTQTARPNGWHFLELNSGANAFYTGNNGSSSTSDTYSYGATGNSDRAFGMLRSPSTGHHSRIGVRFQNDIGRAITQLAVSYTGEQWRLGAADGNTDYLDAEYSLNATSLSTGTWFALDVLDFASPTIAGPTGALDGNASANRTAISAVISIDIADGATFWLRWVDRDIPNAEDGLAIDDFSLTATAPAPVPLPLAAVAGMTLMPLAVGFARRTRLSGRD